MERGDSIWYVSSRRRGSSLTGMCIMLAAHVTSQDEIYNGYFIPKGTSLLGNMWFVDGGRQSLSGI